MKLNKFYNYNDFLAYIRKDPDLEYKFSSYISKVRSNWEINVPIIKDEPDFYAWKNNHLCCVILRRIPNGNLNGYVIVNKKHPAYDMCSDLDEYFKVHGGVTLSESGDNWTGGELNLSHIINKDCWVFGFDTMHSMDLEPNDCSISPYRGTNKVYRNFTYVLHEVTKLAEQIDKIKGGASDN